jgi:hypothetical protein
LVSDDALESVLLPGDFHRDPADLLIVSLARRLGVAVVTSDRRVLGYEHVQSDLVTSRAPAGVSARSLLVRLTFNVRRYTLVM